MYKMLNQSRGHNMDKVFVRNFLLFVLLLGVCATALIYNFVRGDRELERIDDWVVHTRKVINEAEQLEANIRGMLSAQRGYLLTANKDFIEDYNLRKSDVSGHITAMQELTIHNASQQDRLADLHTTYLTFTKMLEDRSAQTDLKNNQEILDDVEIINALKEQVVMINKEILIEEDRLLDKRIQALETKKTQYLTTLIAGVVIGSILLLLFNSFLYIAQRKRSIIEATLKDAEDLFKLAADGTSDGIFDWNIKTNEVYYTAQYFKMLGHDKKAQTSTTADFFNYLHPDDKDKAWSNMQLYLGGNLSEYSQEFRLKHKLGHWIWVQARAKALFDKKNKPYRMVGVHTDITPLKREQEKLEAEVEQAEEANIAKRDFLAHMSHEIRTPLTAISGIAEIFQRNKNNLDDKQKKLINTLNTSTSALKDLVNDILDFSRIESGELELDEQVFSLERIFAQVISMMSVRANEKGVRFTFDDTAVKGSEFYGDDLRLRQVLVNLIGNALKFTAAGGSVSVEAKYEDREGVQYLRLNVSDTGIGISPDDFDSIFDRFKQADASVSRRYGGSGLGLPISKNLAQLMGGDIFLSSEIDKGSTFSLLLPVKLDVPQGDMKSPDQSDTNKKLSEKTQASLNDTTKALIVEDYEGNVIVLGYMLDELNIEYDVAENGEAALALWKQGHYDFILMDVQMPIMDGFTATQKIREYEAAENLEAVPIIGMTAHALVGDKDKCISSGMSSYLPKPIVESDFKKVIYEHLKKLKKAA